MRRLISTGSPWETKVGYSRAVQVDNTLYVSATASTDLTLDLYGQTRNALELLEHVLRDNGFALTEVVSSRLVVSDFDSWEEAARAHGEVFAEVRPAFALVHALPFVDPAILVEVELVAVRSVVGAG